MIITGTVSDKTETLPYADVFFSDAAGNIAGGGTISDLSGNYSLEGNGTHVTAGYTAFKRQTKPAASLVNFTLERDVFSLPEVEIKAWMVWPRVLAALIAVAAAYFIYIKFFKK